jgi:hypothetical protein
MMGEEASAATQAHLMTCAACREELGRFQDSVSDFGLASLAWSEARSAELPELGPAPTKPGVERFYPVVSWTLVSCTLAALLLAGLVVPVRTYIEGRHELHAANQGASGGTLDDDAAAMNSPEQIAADNELLANVRFELSRSQASLLAATARERGGLQAGGQRAATAKRIP